MMNSQSANDNELAQLSAIHAANKSCARYQREAGGRDVWQTPAELAASGVGDCEDFAIDAMFRVINAGMTARLGCWWRSDGQMHMVCLVRTPMLPYDPWVLDVVADAVCRLSERPDLTLIYELGMAGAYVDGELVGGVGHVAKWGALLERMALEKGAP